MAVADADRAREIIPFVGVRIGRVPAGDALDRRFEMIEAMLLHQRRQFGAEAAGARRLVHDHAAAGLLDRGVDRVDVERHQRAQVDHLGVDAGLLDGRQRDMHHRAVGQHGHVVAFAHDRGLAERHACNSPRGTSLAGCSGQG